MENYGKLFREKIYSLLSEMDIKVGNKTARVIYLLPDRSNQAALPVCIVGDVRLTAIQAYSYNSFHETFTVPVAIHAQCARSNSTAQAGSFQSLYDAKYFMMKKLYSFDWSFIGTLGGHVDIQVQPEDEMEESKIYSSFLITITIETPAEHAAEPAETPSVPADD